MRCCYFVPVKRDKHAAAGPDKSAQSSGSSCSTSSKLHQPSSNIRQSLLSSSSTPSSPRPVRSNCNSKGVASLSIMKRSQRGEAAKSQSSSKRDSDAAPNSTPLGTTTVLPGHVKHPSSRMTSATTTADLLGVGVAPRPGQAAMARSGGGRHPHPPSGNNSKLKHQCPFDGCPWRFATPYKLRRHIKSHTKETPYLCKECGRGFSVRYNLLMHIQTIHSQPQKFKCPVRGCKDAFHSQSRLNGHLRRIHKNDWKSLQGFKEPPKSIHGNRRGGSISSTDSSDSVPPTPAAQPSRRRVTSHKCPDCEEEFTSKAKLQVHSKLHSSQGKDLLKCSVQGCSEVFSSEEKLSLHLESHASGISSSKSSRQFCCPHQNCSRVFVKQANLRAHLKVHTQDQKFVCCVLDCSQSFTSEGDYNAHLNSHINYGYHCPHCNLTLSSQKRLSFHVQSAHTIHRKGSDSLLKGIQPHMGERLDCHRDHTSLMVAGDINSPPSISPPSSVSHPNSSQTAAVLDSDILKHIDLPGLSNDDIKAVFEKSESWPGKKAPPTNYESDSGYSTYDVSPISSAPSSLNLPVPPLQTTNVSEASLHPPPPGSLSSHPRQIPPQGLPPSLGLLDQSVPNPLFGNPPFMNLPLHQTPSNGIGPASPPGPAPPLIHHHDPMSSPCTSDGGFFSPHSVFNSTSTQNQDTISFFPSQSPVSLYLPHPFLPTPHDFISGNPVTCAGSNGSMFSTGGLCFPDPMHPMGMPVADSFMQELMPQNRLPPCSLPIHSGGSVNLAFMDCSPQSDILFPGATPTTTSSGGGNVDGSGSNPCIGGVPLEIDMPPSLLGIKQSKEEDQTLGRPSAMERRESLECTTMSPTSPLSVCSHVSLVHEPAPNTCPATPLVSSTTGDSTKPPSVSSPPPDLDSFSPTVTTTTGESAATPTSSGKADSSSSLQQTKKAMKGGVSVKGQNRNVTMKAKKKSPWPKSMNKANLLAFREHIRNKLKKNQDLSCMVANSDTTVPAAEDCNPSSSSSCAMALPPLVKCEVSSPSSVFEAPVTYERNSALAVPTTKRSLSEPSGLVLDEDTDTLLRELNFNPDILLASNLDLGSLDLKFDPTSDEDGVSNESSGDGASVELAELLSSTEDGSFPSELSSSPPTSTMSDHISLNVACIHNFLMEQEDCGSGDLVLICSSPLSRESPGSTPHSCTSPLTTTPTSSNTLASPAACTSSQCPEKLVEAADSFHFPEVFTMSGCLTGASNCTEEESIFQSSHDPLFTSDNHQVPLFNAS